MKTSALFLVSVVLLAPIFAAEPTQPPSTNRNFKVIQASKAIYPLRMIEEGVRNGVAKAALHINSKGELVDLLVVACSKRAFADEAERVVRKWKFEPALINGEPIEAVLEATFNFEVDGVMLVQMYGDSIPSHAEFFPEYEYQACSLKRLDGIPTPVHVVPPTYPREWAEQGITGRVVVDFYIDETGRTRFVAGKAGSNPSLAGIAVAAVSQWKFAPPTRKGKPVLVHAQQLFEFRKEGGFEKN